MGDANFNLNLFRVDHKQQQQKREEKSVANHNNNYNQNSSNNNNHWTLHVLGKFVVEAKKKSKSNKT